MLFFYDTIKLFIYRDFQYIRCTTSKVTSYIFRILIIYVYKNIVHRIFYNELVCYMTEYFITCLLQRNINLSENFSPYTALHNRNFYMEKGSIFSILPFFRQNRNYGNNARIKKIKNTLSCNIPITYLTKYELNRSTLKNQLEHASYRGVFKNYLLEPLSSPMLIFSVPLEKQTSFSLKNTKNTYTHRLTKTQFQQQLVVSLHPTLFIDILCLI